ncbi:MAG: prepilin-type N-terminal cleavage/methylation domain-containing protein [Lachnospiraceae bacterium]|jgi:type IV pilus assembly protein PilA|nr:prepilin-type N-terminal cleavage/methylation domain-containing protein [Lachnospiraceae bacterium]MCH4027372.1 prepilin-type N-terminal cleavage/methylation domain-containing protein [Lachnospiraceae bacterium]MCH4065212.1 prepilin-type N-terminal cleavage/methylation domain-containing protein [Lachnospiraceae bacterium]MCH4111252.1 prepilin-type N-terminal cleavage/methylation domain-containing protein [Lachnospiraceae bacterium]
MKKRNKGFTLAELLIVVAIIGVLVAISIPIFSKLVEKARFATNVANARSAYAAVEAEFLTNDYHPGGTETLYSYDTETGKVGIITKYDPGEYAGVGPDWSTPSSWTIIDTQVNGTRDRALGKRVYKRWILVVVKATGKVRQYMVYFK